MSMTKKRSLLRLLLIAVSALTAGAGCAKPPTTPEKLIASNSEVAALDVDLNRAYRDAMRRAPAPKLLQSEQKKWLTSVRNRCSDAKCLISAYTLRNAQLAAGAVAASTCPAEEKDLLSNWKRVDEGDFEEFALERQVQTRAFASWLHRRPEMMGTWTFANCTLRIIHPDNEKLSFEYRIIGLRNQVLQLEEVGGTARSAYKQIR